MIQDEGEVEHESSGTTYGSLPLPKYIKLKQQTPKTPVVGQVPVPEPTANRWTEEGMALYNKTCNRIQEDRNIHKSFDGRFHQWRMKLKGATEKTQKRKAAAVEVYNDLGN